ncbi:MAG: iron-sulfur cluster assembly scaffold protein [Candidatus Levybacteria bacterium]|nr:iron-sulfur cluster assembly scaffold protein [Candidatus Levybacteria bacterium]
MQDPLYREIILEHWKNPQNYGILKNPDIDVSEVNKICGDRIRLTGKIKNGKLAEVAFIGEGCAISKASSSLFTQDLKGMELAKIIKIDKEKVLKNLPISISPARYNCALLCFRALQKSLKK